MAVTTPVTNTSPTTCSFDIGLVVPKPTLSVAPNGAREIVPFASTSILGIPVISLTANMEPEDRLFTILNN